MAQETNLNEEQHRAVVHTDGPLLLIAGAGAGKTRVITHRIAHLISQGVTPSEILAVTFTNKAANEMRERVMLLLQSENPTQTLSPFIATFHSLGVFMLKEHGQLLGLSRWFSIYDRDESKSVIKKIIKSLGYDPKEFDPGQILSAISRAKGDMILANEYEVSANSYFKELVARAWHLYDQKLKDAGVVDFDDLLIKPIQLLKENPNLLSHYQTKWKYIHIDEYQDTNAAQYELTRLLASLHNNICVVGDMDQNIYSWRGANIRNILNFGKDFPGTTTILLEENYRSTSTILQAANEIIKKNKIRKEKNLFTKNEAGELLSLREAFDERDEAMIIAEKIENLIKNKVPEDEIAVLYRANFQSRIFEEVLSSMRIPYRLVGTSYYDRKEVKDVIAYVKVALNPKDTENLARILNVPRRGIGEKTASMVINGEQNSLPKKALESVHSFFEMINYLGEILRTRKPSEAVKSVLEKTKLLEYYKEMPDGDDRVGNAKELVNIAARYDVLGAGIGLESMLSDIALATDQDNLLEEGRGVRLMTIHAAKGLEFAHVFLPGLEQGLFPQERQGDLDGERGEEERRLMYVAITRAKERVYISHANTRLVFGERRVSMPSEFIKDIPNMLFEDAPELFSSERNPYRKSDGRTNLLGDFIEY